MDKQGPTASNGSHDYSLSNPALFPMGAGPETLRMQNASNLNSQLDLWRELALLSNNSLAESDRQDETSASTIITPPVPFGTTDIFRASADHSGSPFRQQTETAHRSTNQFEWMRSNPPVFDARANAVTQIHDPAVSDAAFKLQGVAARRLLALPSTSSAQQRSAVGPAGNYQPAASHPTAVERQQPAMRHRDEQRQDKANRKEINHHPCGTCQSSKLKCEMKWPYSEDLCRNCAERRLECTPHKPSAAVRSFFAGGNQPSRP
ncbi:hypothetical protein BD410DRAFT_176485 [Rickenella mellea]|uniref:Zn(2)-C6 fungal-type domain-containing protein n=1 Tax=Rickenella mellea TaxID=50990 RepID=A0A4Y7Q6J6_9AGAM|nr:hypothetical protein BD410DRAFT_176485 [Rickenella mellea]